MEQQGSLNQKLGNPQAEDRPPIPSTGQGGAQPGAGDWKGRLSLS